MTLISALEHHGAMMTQWFLARDWRDWGDVLLVIPVDLWLCWRRASCCFFLSSALDLCARVPEIKRGRWNGGGGQEDPIFVCVILFWILGGSFLSHSATVKLFAWRHIKHYNILNANVWSIFLFAPPLTADSAIRDDWRTKRLNGIPPQQNELHITNIV